MDIKVQDTNRTPNGPEKKIFSSHNNQNTKCTEQRKNIKSCKGKGPSNIQRQTYQNHIRCLNRDYESQKSLSEVMQTLREHKCQPRQLYSGKLSINIDRENKIFQDKPKFKQYISTNPALQRTLEEKLQHKEGTYTKEKTRY
jgi:predicted HicB family RNase H-like nuclease